MMKKHAVILWLVLGAVALWLLWRNRSTVAPKIYNAPLPSYMDVAYPSLPEFNPPPAVSASCGCNPQASAFLTNTASAVKETELQIEEQLKNYVDSINDFFQSNSVS